SGVPWLPVHEDYETVNVEVQEKDADSVLNWFKKLAQIRKEYPVLETGDFEEILVNDPDLIGYVRKDGEESLCVLINLSTVPALFKAEEAEGRELILSNYSKYEKGSLAPLQCVILR
ncbi:MAG: DUF3459 domain-containing protein, partial [Erysipelotrichaceae bacterium]|nr:DUF3459 domain-containing protein [Erysipelotrichaceae bacterium]